MAINVCNVCTLNQSPSPVTLCSRWRTKEVPSQINEVAAHHVEQERAVLLHPCAEQVRSGREYAGKTVSHCSDLRWCDTSKMQGRAGVGMNLREPNSKEEDGEVKEESDGMNRKEMLNCTVPSLMSSSTQTVLLAPSTNNFLAPPKAVSSGIREEVILESPFRHPEGKKMHVLRCADGS